MKRAGKRNGDCLRACIASILKIDLEKVPDFSNLDENGTDNPKWLNDLSNWVFLKHKLGCLYLEVDSFGTHKWPVWSNCFAIAGGRVKKNDTEVHAVVVSLENVMKDGVARAIINFEHNPVPLSTYSSLEVIEYLILFIKS